MVSVLANRHLHSNFLMSNGTSDSCLHLVPLEVEQGFRDAAR
jgi:hypothetical protein